MCKGIHPPKNNVARLDNDPNRIVYEAIPKYDGKSVIDHHSEALDVTVLPQWRNSFEYNQRDFFKSQVNFNFGWDELKKELEVPDWQQAKKQIDVGTEAIRQMVLSPDGRLAASVSEFVKLLAGGGSISGSDRLIRIWDPSTWTA